MSSKSQFTCSNSVKLYSYLTFFKTNYDNYILLKLLNGSQYLAQRAFKLVGHNLGTRSPCAIVLVASAEK